MKDFKKSIILLFILLVVCHFTLVHAETKAPEQKITFNFVDVEIPTVIKFISEITGKNFIFDERIKGKITIIAPTKLSVDESFMLFTSVLELKGYTIVPSGTKAYKVIPSTMAKHGAGAPVEEKMPVDESYITRLLLLEHIEAGDAANFLRPMVSPNGHMAAFGPGNLILVVDSALNIEKIDSILKKIDQPQIHEKPIKINVYPLENADATELAKVLDGIIKSAQASRQAAPRAPTTPLFEAVGGISITPNKATNSLIIVASPSDYQNLIQVIKSLDKRRKQVFVEAMIIEASIDKLKELGAKWRARVRHRGEPIAIGGFGTIDSTAFYSVINGLTGFTAGGMGNFLTIPVSTVGSDGTVTTSNLTTPGFAALFSLSEFKGAINVLSTPQILTSDNQEAEIVVGENVPFISKRERDITTTGTVLSSIERKDVGIALKITPQITEGDYVKLDLYQEISSVKETTESIITSVGPTTTKRSTKTSVVVKDAQAVVIGGLMQEREEETLAKTPVLGDIPILGWLFNYRTLSKKKTNLLVFLTPHIVRESEQLARITTDKHRAFAMAEKQYAEGELMVKFKEGVSEETAKEIILQKGAEVIKFIKEINLYHLRLRAEQSVEEAIKEFSLIPEVFYAEPNYRVKIQGNNPAPNKDKEESKEKTSSEKDHTSTSDNPTNSSGVPYMFGAPIPPPLSGSDIR